MESNQSTRYTPIEKDKIRFYYYMGSGSVILFLTLLLSFIYIQSLDKEFRNKISQLSEGIINEKKRFLKNAVERTINLIETERSLVKLEFSSRNISKAQLDKISVERVSYRIRRLRLIDNGYVWVNRIVDYKGGDKYAVRQIHPNLLHTEGQWLSTATTDIKGNLPYQAELEGIKKKGELYFDYYFKKMKSDKIAHKMSYAKLYKPWDWVVATGVYLDDVDELVRRETEKMEATLRTQTFYTILAGVLAFLISTFVLVRFEKQISNLLLSHENKIEIYTNRLISEKEKTQSALDEVKQLKGLLPICSSCKKIRDDSGYWNQLEVYFRDHSEVQFSHGICPDCAKKLYPELNIHKE